MKYAYILTIFLISCTKDPQPEAAPPIEAPRLADPNRQPDLYIPELESGWDVRDGLLGIRVGQPFVRAITLTQILADRFNLPVGQTIMVVGYNCPIANKAPQIYSPFYGDYSGGDLVIPRNTGVPVPGNPGAYTYPGIGSFKVFNHGVKYGATQKVDYGLGNTEHRTGFDALKMRVYGTDTMRISAQCADTYSAIAPVPSINGQIVDGKYVIVVKVNPDTLITESDYSNNVSTLPISIVNNVATVDTSALSANLPPTPQNFRASIVWGKSKYVTLQWDGPTDHVHILRDGVGIPYDDAYIYGNSFTDTNLPNGWKGSTYTIVSHIPGIGKSQPVTLQVKR